MNAEIPEKDASERVALLEAKLVQAQSDVREARELIASSREPMMHLETRLRRQWQRRRADIDSMRLSERAANACGLGRSGSTTISIQRFRSRIEEAAQEIRRIHTEAASACEDYTMAWNLLRFARAEEAGALVDLSEFRTSEVAAMRELDQRRLRAARDLEKLERVREREETERAREIARITDDHYDPQYDEWELALRRARPWV